MKHNGKNSLPNSMFHNTGHKKSAGKQEAYFKIFHKLIVCDVPYTRKGVQCTLSFMDKGLYCYLLNKQNLTHSPVKESISFIASYMGVSKPTIRSSLEALELCGFITKSACGKGRDACNEYMVAPFDKIAHTLGHPRYIQTLCEGEAYIHNIYEDGIPF